MKANWLRWLLLLLLASAAFQLSAQQSEANRKLLADVRAKAEKGDAKSQCELVLLSLWAVSASRRMRRRRRSGIAKPPSRITRLLNSIWVSATTMARAWRRMRWRR